jgi:hypothetical protein
MNDKLLCITITHHIFLNREQRYQLSENDGVEIDVTGITVPVWCRTAMKGPKPVVITDEPSPEIFCRYVVSSREDNQIIEALADGYQISLEQSAIRQKLLDSEDAGEEILTFQHYSTVDLGGTEYRVVHFVIIKDEKEMLDTVGH